MTGSRSTGAESIDAPVDGEQDVPGAIPLAGGQPISGAVADQAAAWLTLLMSGEVADADRQHWQAWRAADAEHERAWQHIESVTGRLKALEPRAAYGSLSPYAGASRRQTRARRNAIRTLVWGGLAASAVLLTPNARIGERIAADHRTGTGERRSVRLDDGTLVMLNTETAVALRFDDRVRRLDLLAGEILVETVHAGLAGGADPRPFVVGTAAGTVRALGTRFTVRQRDDRAEVVVLAHAVEIRPRDTARGPTRVVAGERAAFTPAGVAPPLPSDDAAIAWARGQLVADDMALCDFVAEVGRYRAGVLRCTPAAAGLRVSGVFPLQDTDRILATLPQVLPVAVRRRSRYWVIVDAAP